MKYYIIAGEASGDLHASNLMKEIKLLDKEADFRCWGGNLMQNQGATIVKHYKDLAFMGFLEVLLNLKTILKNIKLCKSDILSFKPDVIILVDFPGFNLRIAEFAHNLNLKVYYYISPQVWAWNKSRVKKIKKNIDKLFVILPFEKDFFLKYNYSVDFVGHPLLDAISQHTYETNLKVDETIATITKPIFALLPGSRKQEIKKVLPIMLEMIKTYRDYQFVIAKVSSIDETFYKTIIKDASVKLVTGSTYQLLEKANVAMVTSGTATLETALFGVPQVVCYKGSGLSYQIAKRLVKIKYISLVNLIMDNEIVKELIQNDLNYNNLKSELDMILYDNAYQTRMKDNYANLKHKLGNSGASKLTAEKMMFYLKHN